MLKQLLYVFTAFTCCGVVFYQVYTDPLADYVPTHPRIDNATYGNVDEISTYNFFMDVTVDFDTRTIYGSNTLDLQAQAITDKVVLDIWDMDIYAVELVKPQAGLAAADETRPRPVVALQ